MNALLDLRILIPLVSKLEMNVKLVGKLFSVDCFFGEERIPNVYVFECSVERSNRTLFVDSLCHLTARMEGMNRNAFLT